MTFELRIASDWDYVKSFTISTIEELKALQDEYGDSLIVDFRKMRILVYDTWIE